MATDVLGIKAWYIPIAIVNVMIAIIDSFLSSLKTKLYV